MEMSINVIGSVHTIGMYRNITLPSTNKNYYMPKCTKSLGKVNKISKNLKEW